MQRKPAHENSGCSVRAPVRVFPRYEWSRFPRIRKTMVFVLLALFLGQFGSGVYDLVFSNFLRDASILTWRCVG